MIDQVHVISLAIARDIQVLAEFQVAVRTEHDRTSIAPGTQAVGREPVHTEVEVGTVVSQETRVAEILEGRVVRVVIVGHLAVQHAGVLRGGIVQALLNLMAADVHENAAVLLRVPEPVGAVSGTQPVRAEADHLQHAADGTVPDELPGMDGGFDVQSFGVVDGEFAARFSDFLARCVELLERRKRRLVGEVIFAVVQRPQPERTALARHRRWQSEPAKDLRAARLPHVPVPRPDRSCKTPPSCSDPDRKPRPVRHPPR